MNYFPGFFLSADAALWVDRMEAGCEAFESLFGVRLERATSGTKHNVTEKEISNRLKFFEGRLKTSNRWFSLFSGNGFRRTTGSFENVDYFSLGGNVYFGELLYRVSFTLPPQSLGTHEQLLVKLGDALQAQSAQFIPSNVAERLRLAHWCTVFGTSVMRNTLEDKTKEEENLPVICESTYAGLYPLQPHHFGWLNYWSQDVCAYVGFPANAQGLEILQHSYQTPRGAWIVKLGAEPLEARNAAHVRLLREMYERFPSVGVRLKSGTDAQPRAAADGPEKRWPAAEL